MRVPGTRNTKDTRTKERTRVKKRRREQEEKQRNMWKKSQKETGQELRIVTPFNFVATTSLSLSLPLPLPFSPSRLSALALMRRILKIGIID